MAFARQPHLFILKGQLGVISVLMTKGCVFTLTPSTFWAKGLLVCYHPLRISLASSLDAKPWTLQTLPDPSQGRQGNGPSWESQSPKTIVGWERPVLLSWMDSVHPIWPRLGSLQAQRATWMALSRGVPFLPFPPHAVPPVTGLRMLV